MKHYEEVLKLLHDQFDWKLTDSLTTTGKKLVADTIKALKIAENNQTLQLQQTGVVGRSEQLPCPHCGQLEPCAGNSPETCYHPKVC